MKKNVAEIKDSDELNGRLDTAKENTGKLEDRTIEKNPGWTWRERIKQQNRKESKTYLIYSASPN